MCALLPGVCARACVRVCVRARACVRVGVCVQDLVDFVVLC